MENSGSKYIFRFNIKPSFKEAEIVLGVRYIPEDVIDDDHILIFIMSWWCQVLIHYYMDKDLIENNSLRLSDAYMHQ